MEKGMHFFLLSIWKNSFCLFFQEKPKIMRTDFRSSGKREDNLKNAAAEGRLVIANAEN